MKNHLLTPSVKLFSCLFILLSFFSLQSQTYKFSDKYSLPTGTGPQEPLKVKMSAPDDLYSYPFLNKVGGVAFQNVAIPDSALTGQDVSVFYNEKEADGKRLQVVIGSDTLFSSIYDWQLIPIANYAESEYNSCVSLFGPNSNDDAYHTVYHESFQNTLLGVRLLQADIMLLDLSEFWQLPTYDGRKVMGAGESEPSENQWRTAALRLRSALMIMRFQSYVMTDYGEDVVFSNRDGELILSGRPYYHFWQADMAAFQLRQMEKMNEINALTEKMNAIIDTLNRNPYIDSAKRDKLLKKHDDMGDRYNELVNEFNAMEPEIIVIETLNEQIKERRNELSQYNPAVYGAATNTMRYAALFRYIKTSNSENWQDFLTSIKNTDIVPDVLTPISWPRH